MFYASGRLLAVSVATVSICSTLLIAAALAASPDDDQSRAPIQCIEVETSINATLAQIWRAWTTNQGLREFLCPDSNVELRIGGPYEIYFSSQAPEGERGSEGCAVLSYLPMEMLSFTWNAPPHFVFARQHHTWVVLRFDETAQGQSRVRLAHLGFEELALAHPDHAEEFSQTREYFARAWPHVLAALKSHLETNAPPAR